MNAPPGYDLEELLGDGGMGTVYRARQRSSGGRVVAIKRVRTPGDADLLARIQREAEILAALDHPHIVPVYEFVPDGQGIAIAMQYAPGGSLADRLAAEGRLDATSVVEFAAPIAQALASAHRRGVLHRDIKPGNILFTSDGEPLLSDFGVARWAGAKRLTRPTGLQLGTAEYLDPEVADGAPPDERSDLYSLGLVCYEALTGSPPYTGPTPLSVLRATDRGEYMPLAEAAPDCPPVLAQVVERAIARRPEDRFATAADFAAALRRAELAAQAPRVPDGRQPGPGQQLRAAGQPAPAPAAAQPLVRRSGPPVVEARPTRTFGPRPVASAELTKPPPRVPKALVWVVAAVLLLLPVVLVVLFRGRTSAEEPSRKPSAMEVITLTPIAPPPCAPLPPPLPQPGEKPLTGDPDGDGCPSYMTWRDNVVWATVDSDQPERAYELGQPGDQLLLGDWDCNRTDTPALYRPSTGEVFLFSKWARPGERMDSAFRRDSKVLNGVAVVRDRGAPDTCADIVEVEASSPAA